MDKLLTLTEWAEKVYGDNPPSLQTLQRWARDCRIYPTPEKQGRCYYVLESARYIDPTKPIKMVREPSPRGARSHRGTNLSLVERLRLEEK